MTPQDMAKGLALLGVAFSRDLSDEIAELYHGVLGSRLSVEQWEKAVGRALEDERFFPPPAVLLRYALPAGVPQARAVEVYLHLVDGYQSGRGMDQRDIGEKFGPAARDAFLAAGGRHAFEWCEEASEPFRRKAFVDAWVEVYEQSPAAALTIEDRRQNLLAESDELLP
jgi:hypothetical protein